MLDSNGGFLVGGRKYDTTTRFDFAVARFQAANATPVASSVSVDGVAQVGNKTVISFSIANGGPFDADGDANNNRIQDPIVPASGSLSNTVAIPSLSQLGIIIMILMMGLGTLVTRRRLS